MINSHFSSGIQDTNNCIVLDHEDLSLEKILNISKKMFRVEITELALRRIDASRNCIEKRIDSGGIYYGINTGFGALSNVRISNDNLVELQRNLILSHSCGVGEPLDEVTVRTVLVLRIHNILRGHSGARREVVEIMRDFLNLRITPFVPCKGSVGASGDLAPLSHIALNLMGEGRVFYDGRLAPAVEILDHLGVTPLIPQAKEGLCLINGTQVMTAIGLLACAEVSNLIKSSDIVAAVSLNAFKGTATAFRKEIQLVRPHKGQLDSSQNVLNLLTQDEILTSHKDCDKVQDPYSFRCVPQVHGAVRNAFDHVFSTLLIEANSSTDNPLVFSETNEILSGGNFHGQIVATVLDYLAIAVSEIASISERRIEKLVNPHMSGLPAFLSQFSGLNSGYMIPHVVSAALVNENKVLSTPASVDSIPTSAEKEDHVSMGMTSALKLVKIVKNVSYVLGIELMAAVEGVEFHLPLKGGMGIRAAESWLRSYVAPMKNQDRSLSMEIELISQKLLDGELVANLEAALGHYKFV